MGSGGPIVQTFIRILMKSGKLSAKDHHQSRERKERKKGRKNP